MDLQSARTKSITCIKRGQSAHLSMSCIWENTICRAPMKMIQGVCEKVQGLSGSSLVVPLKW